MHAKGFQLKIFGNFRIWLVWMRAGIISRMKLLIFVLALALNAWASQDPAPLLPENSQYFEDWVDHASHPLGMGHHYQSSNRTDAGLGRGWTHPWSVSLQIPGPQGSASAPQDGEVVYIQFAQGQSLVFFKAPGTNAAWRPSSGVDKLASIPGEGWLYTRANDESRWSFDAAGRLLSMTSRNGWAYRLTYADDGRLSVVSNAFGRRLVFGWSAAGRLKTVNLPDGGNIAYEYDSSGYLKAVRINGVISRSYAYEDESNPGYLTGIDGPEGQRMTSFSYKSGGLLWQTSRADVPGSRRVNAFGAADIGPSGMLATENSKSPYWYQATVSTIDFNGQEFASSYQGDPSGVRQVRWQSALHGRMKYMGFGPDDLPAYQVDFLDNITTYQWDAARQLPISITKNATSLPKKHLDIAWHGMLRLPAELSEAGRITKFTYGPGGGMTQLSVTDTTTGDEYRNHWEYNGANLVASFVDAAGHATGFSYDGAGNLAAVRNANQQITNYTHDGAGRVLSMTAPTGGVQYYAYGPLGRLDSIKLGNMQTRFSYSARGLLERVEWPTGYAVAYEYDGSLRLKGWRDNRGSTGSFVLDPWGHHTQEVIKDGTGQTAYQVQRTFNGLNRISNEATGSIQSTTLAYDANGDLVESVNALGQPTRLTLDGLQRLTKVTDPLNASATLTYNALDAVTSAQDFKGVTTTYTRDALGNAKAETTPDAGNSTATYDALGLIATA
jgi:YD repeat-containing protein